MEKIISGIDKCYEDHTAGEVLESFMEGKDAT